MLLLHMHCNLLVQLPPVQSVQLLPTRGAASAICMLNMIQLRSKLHPEICSSLRLR